MSSRQIVAELTRRDIRAMRGGAWTAATVRNVLLRSGDWLSRTTPGGATHHLGNLDFEEKPLRD